MGGQRKMRHGSIGADEEMMIHEQWKQLTCSSDVFAFDSIAQCLRHARGQVAAGVGADQQKFFACIDKVSCDRQPTIKRPLVAAAKVGVGA